jgi:hypothetical protein
MLERETDIAKDLRALVEAELPAPTDDVDERFATNVLHDEGDVAPAQSSQIVLVNDVWVTNARHETRLAFESRQGVGVGDVFRGDDLDRHVMPGGPVTRQENGAHTTSPQLALDDVVALELGQVDAGIWASCGHLFGELVASIPANRPPQGRFVATHGTNVTHAARIRLGNLEKQVAEVPLGRLTAEFLSS